MGEVLAVITGLIFLRVVFELPEILVPVVIIFLLFKSCSVEVEETIEESTNEFQNEQIESIAVEDSVREECIDGIVWLFVTKDGKDYMASKENRYGDNERCYE